MDTLMVWWRNLILVVCALMALMLFLPDDSPLWGPLSVFGSNGSACPTFVDSNGNGIPEAGWLSGVGAPDRCYPDHQDYVQPHPNAWPPDPSWAERPKETRIP